MCFVLALLREMRMVRPIKRVGFGKTKAWIRLGACFPDILQFALHVNEDDIRVWSPPSSLSSLVKQAQQQHAVVM